MRGIAEEATLNEQDLEAVPVMEFGILNKHTASYGKRLTII